MRSMHWESRELARNWSKEKFMDLHHEDFLFIRETELLTRDEHFSVINRLATETDYFKKYKPQLVHENEFISEARFEDNDEIVTRVFIMKQRKIWRQIVSRTPIEEVA